MTSVCRRAHADAAVEQVAEAPQTAEADFQADGSDRKFTDGEQESCLIEARVDSVLVRCLAEQAGKYTDELAGGQTRFLRHQFDRRRLLDAAKAFAHPSHASDYR